MFKKKTILIPYDKSVQKPVIRSSICTGEQVAGFKDIETGKFTEVMVIRSEKDMSEFLKRYDITAEEVKREW
ncbi:MAG: hypothetical protein NC086_03240 [Alistipes sp.]|nr:hypothetical protein [Alistipes sp.]